MQQMDKLFLLLITACFSYSCFSETAESKSGVFLSEIMFFPKENEPQWVEIANYGKENASVAGWCVTDYDGNVYQFPKEFPSLPPGAAVAIIFWEKDSPPPQDNLAFDQNKPIIVYQRREQRFQKTVFEAESDQCGLYSSAEMSEKTIQDFVCWGIIPNIDSLDPIKSYLWQTNNYLKIRTNPKTTPIGESVILRESSIARLRCTNNRISDWKKCSIEDVSIGQINPHPRPYFDDWGHRVYEIYFPKIFWYCTEPCLEYRFQMAADEDFKTLLVDVTTKEINYDFNVKKFNFGKYYWRVKGISENNIETAWSVIEVQLKKRPAPLSKAKLDELVKKGILKQSDVDSYDLSEFDEKK